jgi:small multidrug resistance pump/quaternary ammonium compound-resistance protein SugE
MPLLQLLLASMLYAVGGVFMKLSAGLSRPWPTLAFLTLFVLGAVLQALGIRDAEMGPSYVLVLGAEAVVAVFVSALYLRESYPPSRLVAIALVLAGIVLLRRT